MLQRHQKERDSAEKAYKSECAERNRVCAYNLKLKFVANHHSDFTYHLNAFECFSFSFHCICSTHTLL